MALGFGKGKEEDVVSLIAAKKYARAIEVLKAQLQKKGANPSLRMQLADVLILADKRQEAVALLLPLADQYARDGFAAKARAPAASASSRARAGARSTRSSRS